MLLPFAILGGLFVFAVLVRRADDCSAGHPAARRSKRAWLALDLHETKYMDDGEGGTLGIRSCRKCGTSLCREVEGVHMEAK